MFIVRCHIPENLAELFTFLQRVQHDRYRAKSWAQLFPSTGI